MPWPPRRCRSAPGRIIASVAAVLREFPGLEHRLEFVREKDGVTYINDSKGTNVGAVVKSVEGFHAAGDPDRRRPGQGKRLQPALRSVQAKSEALDPDRQGSGQDGRRRSAASTETVFAQTLQDAVQACCGTGRLGRRGAAVARMRELRHVQGFRGPGQAV